MILDHKSSIEDISQFGGGKATSLWRMHKQGLKVPSFKVYDTRFFDQHIKKEEIKDYISNEQWNLIHDQIMNLEIKVQSSYPLCSVRSSANLEDGSQHSFAGIYESYLFIEDNIDLYIKKCWCSLFTKEHFEYLKKRELNFELIKMAVIVQEMVTADKSGIYFQAHPNGSINEKLLVCGFGAGEGIVNATVETETIQIDSLSERFNNTETYLTNHQVEQIISACENYTDGENLFFDFEFALSNDQIYFLQARPITTVNQSKDIVLYDSSNISENYPGISTPLTLSNLQQMYGLNLETLMRYLGYPDSLINRMRVTLYNASKDFYGRPYYRVNSWYQILQTVPLFGKSFTKSWDLMIGAKGTKNIPLYKTTLIESLLIIINTFPKLLSYFLFPHRKSVQYQKQYESFWKWIKQYRYADLSYDQLMQIYHKAERKYFSFGSLALLNDLMVSLHLKLVVENGNLLSHAAIIGRELGIPTIIDIPGATNILKSRQKIRIDGQTGAIELK